MLRIFAASFSPSLAVSFSVLLSRCAHITPAALVLRPKGESCSICMRPGRHRWPLSLSLSPGVGIHACSKCAGAQCVVARGTPAHAGVRHKEPAPPEHWAQASENRPSDSARVRGANQAPGTGSQATALVVYTAGLLAQGQRGVKSV